MKTFHPVDDYNSFLHSGGGYCSEVLRRSGVILHLVMAGKYWLSMIRRDYIGWVRDERGKIVGRPVRHIANAVTSFVGGGISDEKDGLSNTSPHIVYTFEW